MAFENYRKAKKDEITCAECKYSRLRWYSKRLECKYLLGMIQELVCWAGAGKYYPARECRCRGEGHPDCLFEIQRQPAG